MDLFDKDGHLTEYAFELLLNGGGNELERLEISEHLSFCDDCMIHYTNILTDDTLIIPKDSVLSSVMSHIKRRTRRIFMNKYATVTVAACFAIILWNSGLIGNESIIINQQNTRVVQGTNGLIELANHFTINMANGINKIFDIDFKEVLFNGEK